MKYFSLFVLLLISIINKTELNYQTQSFSTPLSTTWLATAISNQQASDRDT